MAFEPPHSPIALEPPLQAVGSGWGTHRDATSRGGQAGTESDEPWPIAKCSPARPPAGMPRGLVPLRTGSTARRWFVSSVRRGTGRLRLPGLAAATRAVPARSLQYPTRKKGAGPAVPLE